MTKRISTSTIGENMQRWTIRRAQLPLRQLQRELKHFDSLDNAKCQKLQATYSSNHNFAYFLHLLFSISNENLD